MNIYGIARKRSITGAILVSSVALFTVMTPGVASARDTTSCSGQYVFGPIHLESVASEAGSTDLNLGNHDGEAIVFPPDTSETQEWSGYRDAECRLIIYNGTGDDVLTASVGAHCIPHYRDCVTVEPYAKGDQYQEWTRDIYGSVWALHLLSGVDSRKAVTDPHGRDVASLPAVLTTDHDTNKATQWQT